MYKFKGWLLIGFGLASVCFVFAVAYKPDLRGWSDFVVTFLAGLLFGMGVRALEAEKESKADDTKKKNGSN